MLCFGLIAGLSSCGGNGSKTPPATTKYSESVLYTFGTGGGSGSSPLISDSQGNLYGTAQLGGKLGGGVVFKLTSPGSSMGSWTETVLYAFSGGLDGRNPSARLTFDGKGNLYGTTVTGGVAGTCFYGTCGVVFMLSPPASGTGPWTETVLYSFTGGADGGRPDTGVIFDTMGNLYGTSQDGGSLDQCALMPCGSVFRLTPPASGTGRWTETVLYSFTGFGDGGNPGELTFSTDGKLYGTALTAGSGGCDYAPDLGVAHGCGVVFELIPANNGNGAWTESVLYSFIGAVDGGNPGGKLVPDSQGNLYGTTAVGGVVNNCVLSGGNVSGCGVVFKLSRPSNGTGPWTETVLYAFSGAADGARPQGLILDSLGNLAGTAFDAGKASANCFGSGCGVAFTLFPPSTGSGPWTYTLLYSFTGGPDGGAPTDGLILDAKGNFYGTTSSGGISSGQGAGVVFMLKPSS